jgi:hypothetical protein
METVLSPVIIPIKLGLQQVFYGWLKPPPILLSAWRAVSLRCWIREGRRFFFHAGDTGTGRTHHGLAITRSNMSSLCAGS